MALASPFQFIPSQFHLACLFLTGIAGFFIVIGFSSAKPMPASTSRNVQVKTEPEEISEPQQPEISTPQPSSPGSVAASEQSEMPLAASTPKKVAVSTPVSTPQKEMASEEDDANPKSYGSLATPGGRRSARIARSAKKPAR
mmetsp:Transcript_23954/g.35640  ORF Transcript_23954/g.35640 Transcript_23954/m.35640 type:complete len:142 (+) Transcript_23954:63-488(+)|eukprot:CAMPEP_0194078258 /NCGR_PEP_ID=MMETSP0149-20130528/4706_1 /TAXON_ID=122233 /ORGANISM="Chaetoceros debilis, Strain MM31A-1" /LENGTH=141 /DNA_ID=CAMNT_0038759487 /DNA_START=22 /DNA_END=447 /DNA_ORIENTATION=+